MGVITIRQRVEPMQAWQWTGQPRALWPAWVQRCCELRKGELCHMRQSGDQFVYRGEWLVKELDGDAVSYTDDEIQREFEPR